MWPATPQALQALSVATLWVATVAGAIAVAAGWVSTVSNNKASDLTQASADKRQVSADKRIADATARGREALALVAVANEGLAKANAETAKANALAAVANDSAEQARLEQEVMKADNLAFEAAISPRLLKQNRGNELSEFVPTKLSLVVVPEFESRRLAGQISFLTSMGKWPKPSTIMSDDLLDGVKIQYVRRVGDFAASDNSKAARLICDIIRESNIDVKVEGIPDTYAASFGIESNEIKILVGPKSNAYFSNKTLPEWAKTMEDSQKNFWKSRESFLKSRLGSKFKPEPKPDFDCES